MLIHWAGIHEVLFPLLGAFSTKESPIKIGYLPVEYCVWPGESNEDSILTMGLADNEDKKDALRKMGMNEDHIEWQATGNKFLDAEEMGEIQIKIINNGMGEAYGMETTVSITKTVSGLLLEDAAEKIKTDQSMKK